MYKVLGKVPNHGGTERVTIKGPRIVALLSTESSAETKIDDSWVMQKCEQLHV